jgi:hypothetical protein
MFSSAETTETAESVSVSARVKTENGFMGLAAIDL